MLQGITRSRSQAPRRILIVALLLMVGARVYGAPVMDSLSAGGFRKPGVGVMATQRRCWPIQFEQGDMHLIVSVTSDAGVQSETAARSTAARPCVTKLHWQFPFVTQVYSAWNSTHRRWRGR